MPKYVVRKAAPNDVRGIARVQVLAWQTNYRGLLPDSFLDGLSLREHVKLRDNLLRYRAGHKLVVTPTIDSHQVVGFCDGGPSRDLASGTGEIYGLYVAPEFQGHGLGQRLFRRQLALLRASGYDQIHLWVLRDNFHARAFYQRMGGTIGQQQTLKVANRRVPKVSYHWDLHCPAPRPTDRRHAPGMVAGSAE